MTTLPNSLISEGLVYYTVYENTNCVLGYCIINPNNQFRIHYHDTTEVYVVLDGTGEVYENNKWRKVSKGHIFVFGPNIEHCCRTYNEIILAYMFFKGPFNNIKYYSKL